MKIPFFCCCLAVLLVFSSCGTMPPFSSDSAISSSVSEPVGAPKIRITNNGLELKYQPPDGPWKKQESFNRLIQAYGGNVGDLPYIRVENYGGPIEIEFLDERLPDEYELKEFLLDAEGSTRPTAFMGPLPLIENILVPKDNTLSFLLHIRQDSSSSQSPQKGDSCRGFSLRCTWGDKTYEYGFALRSDGLVSLGAATTICTYKGEAVYYNSFITDDKSEIEDFHQPPLQFTGFPDNVSVNILSADYGESLDFTFPEDGLPDSAELINDVMVPDSTGENYEYQGDRRNIPASELTMKDGKLSFIVKPEYFAEGEQNCNVTYVLCTWDGLTSVYTVIFRINP